MTKIWEATTRAVAGVAPGTARIPVDISDSSAPGQVTVDQVLARGGISTFGITRGTTTFEQGSIVDGGSTIARFATVSVLGSSYHLSPNGQLATIGSQTGYLLGGRAAGGNIAGTALIISPDPGSGTSAGAELILCSAPGGASAANTVNQPLRAAFADVQQVFKFDKPIGCLTGSRYGEADEPVTASTTLVSHSDMQCPVLAGRTYAGSAEFTVTAGASGGLKIAMGGPSITSARWQATITDAATGAVVADSFDNLSSSLSVIGGAKYLVRIDFCIRPSAAGTISVQFAQHTSDATATTVLALCKSRFEEAF